MKLGLYGGTFDPVHYGHLLLAERCREELGLDEVRFIPAGDPPHKDRADLTLAITNGSDYGWRGSVRLDLGGTTIPVDIGHVGPGETASETFEVRLDSGRTYEVAGSLLIGP